MREYKKLFKKDSAGKIRVWFITQDKDSYFVTHGIYGGTLVESTPTKAIGKNIGRSNETTPEKQAESEISSMYETQYHDGYHDDLEAVRQGKVKLSFVDPMLCSRWDDKLEEKLRNNPPPVFYSQAKFDGFRCIARKNGLWSRNGKQIFSCPHIMEQLSPVFEKMPNLILDGELYCHDMPFNQLASLIKKGKPTQDDFDESEKYVHYHVYDIPSVADDFGKRFATLEGLNEKRKEYPNITLVETQTIAAGFSSSKNFMERTDALFEKYLIDGYEGQILRFDGSHYEFGKRSKFLVKRKKLYEDGGNEEEYKILDIEEGKGNWSGVAKVLVLEIKDKNNKNTTFKSTLKGTREELAKVLKNKNKYIGKLATVTYQNLSEYGIPRFPVVKELDRTM